MVSLQVVWEGRSGAELADAGATEARMEQHLVYHGGITGQGVRNVETLLVSAMREGAERVVLHICSSGGDVNAGVGLYNFIRALPLPVDTHAFGQCASIAATIFLAGEQRTTVATSAFSLHAATFVEGPLKGQISPNTTLIFLPFKDRIGWDDELVVRYFTDAEEKQILPHQALELRIATGVRDLSFPADPRCIVNVAVPA